MNLSRSARYYRDNPSARAKKNAYDSRYESSRSQKRARAARNKSRRSAIKRVGRGALVGKDLHHKTKKPLHQHKNPSAVKSVVRSVSANRGDK